MAASIAARSFWACSLILSSAFCFCKATMLLDWGVIAMAVEEPVVGGEPVGGSRPRVLVERRGEGERVGDDDEEEDEVEEDDEESESDPDDEDEEAERERRFDDRWREERSSGRERRVLRARRARWESCLS